MLVILSFRSLCCQQLLHEKSASLLLRRENFLGLASWLAVKETLDTTNIMRAQLSRLYGQLYALQGKHAQALQSFADDVYYCSLEYGTQDVRTSLGFYNLGKVFQSKNEMEKCVRCCEQVLDIWLSALTDTVLRYVFPHLCLDSCQSWECLGNFPLPSLRSFI